MDSDILVMNPDFDLSPYFKENGISFSQDFNGLCAGCFAGHGEWFKEFLKVCLFLGDTVIKPEFREQDTIKTLTRFWPSVTEHFHPIPEAVIVNPKTHFTQDPFAIHFWSGAWRDKVSEHIRMARDGGWKPENHKKIFPWFH